MLLPIAQKDAATFGLIEQNYLSIRAASQS